MSSERDNPGIRFPPPLIFLGCLLIGLALDRPDFWPPLALDNGIRLMLGILLAGGGLWLGLSSIGRFRAAGTNVTPWSEASAFVESGAYKRTRNPMYLAMALIMMGAAMLLATRGGLLMVPVALLLVDLFVVRREEAYLTRRFGDDYRAYCRRVRRWF
jgi:protein-S-isoprenylcysteine O-methyltransferase Ste14